MASVNAFFMLIDLHWCKDLWGTPVGFWHPSTLDKGSSHSFLSFDSSIWDSRPNLSASCRLAPAILAPGACANNMALWHRRAPQKRLVMRNATGIQSNIWAPLNTGSVSPFTLYWRIKTSQFPLCAASRHSDLLFSGPAACWKINQCINEWINE